MSDRRFEQAKQDFAADLTALRDDIAKLSGAVSDIMRDRADEAAGQASSFFNRTRDRAADRATRARDQFSSRASDLRDDLLNRASDARGRVADRASDMQDRLGTLGSDLEDRIERNPLTAVVVAAVAGLLMGLLSRSF